jgi:hypothetical protein
MKKRKAEDERLDRLVQQSLQALKVSEAEIAEVSNSPDLYRRVRLRIAAKRSQRDSGRALLATAQTRLASMAAMFGARRRLRWTFAAAAMIVLLAGAATLWLRSIERERITSESRAAREIKSDLASNRSESGKSEPGGGESKIGREISTRPASSRTRHAARRLADQAEITTDYLPLTYLPDAAPDSGQVVRVRIARSALLAMGLPMDVERAGEMVKADVVIGDDGLARAIRFVQ